MKIYIKFICFISMLFISFSVFAEGKVVSKITNVRVDKNGKGYVRFESPLSNTPAACINDHPNHLAFDVNTPAGQA